MPEPYTDLIFEAGVTTRHLSPVRDSNPSAHGAGLALHHIRNSALEARLCHPKSPTSIHAAFDTHATPERSLQSKTRPSHSNLLATAKTFAREHPNLAVFYASPSKILKTLMENHIIQVSETSEQRELLLRSNELGIEASLKTVRRVLQGSVKGAERVLAEDIEDGEGGSDAPPFSVGPTLGIGEDVKAEIAAILGRAARASYLEVGEVKFNMRPGEISIAARVHEPEEEYE